MAGHHVGQRQDGGGGRRPFQHAPGGGHPAGGEDDYVVLEHVGEPREFDFEPRDHVELGQLLGAFDLERGAKVSGSMFTVLRGGLATLSRALCQLALDRNADAYEEIRPPSLVRTDTMVSTGHLPKFADEGYHLERDDLWAIPTAEVPLTSLGRDEILTEADRARSLTGEGLAEAPAASHGGSTTVTLATGDRVRLLNGAPRPFGPPST